ncbi:hypothetical protein GN157_05705 [Flavobacterium rakeshii]|uniref:DUF2147 domain-containing protein n=1 Tax=Flavobacterium rakeshii TaxID=1038845 RepID=A0A6N8HBF7_9FLAO|nr:hypothetical protein [Flavobacterium rakeshii]MUV03200.1 hypothetical protein [Flavobacterium rakeshii]
MKKIFLVLFAIMATSFTNGVTAQTLPNPYTGTWEHQNGNQKFILSIWVDSNNIMLGHYKMITVDNKGQQTGIIYNSKKEVHNSGIDWPHAVYFGDMSNGYPQTLGGPITDNTVNNQRGFIKGLFVFTPNYPLGSTAQWEVKKAQGVREPNEPDFNIPNNILLTKVSNSINLD